MLYCVLDKESSTNADRSCTNYSLNNEDTRGSLEYQECNDNNLLDIHFEMMSILKLQLENVGRMVQIDETVIRKVRCKEGRSPLIE